MFKDLVNKRRSIRKYTDEPLKTEEIECLVEAGLKAPTAKNLDIVELIVVKNRDALMELSEFRETAAGHLKGAGCAIAVISNTELSPDHNRQDACIAATFILLQAEDLDIGACWVNVYNKFDKNGKPADERIREILHIPKKYNVECVIALGYKAEEPRNKKEKNFKEDVHYEKY